MKKWVKHGLELYRQLLADGFKPDIIHGHNMMFAGMLADTIHRQYNIPFVLTEHSSTYLKKTDPPWQKPYANRILQDAGRFITVSSELLRVIRSSHKLDAEKSMVMPNMLGPEFSNIILDPPESGSFKFVHIASLIEVKAQHLLLQAFNQSFAGKSEVKLLIGGDGRLKHELRQLCRELGLESQVEFLGALKRSEVPSLMQRGNAFVLSSMHETFGVVLIEALACGLPLVATRCGGPEEIVNNGNGILVEKNNVNALAAGMKKIYENIGNYYPQTLRDQCLEKYGPEAISNKLTAIYNAVIQ